MPVIPPGAHPGYASALPAAADAWIINRAEEAISQDDEEAARAILAEITQDRPPRH